MLVSKIKPCMSQYKLLSGETANGLQNKRVLEYKVRARFSTEIYGSKREKAVFHKYLQEACFVLTETSESLWKPPGVSGRM